MSFSKLSFTAAPKRILPTPYSNSSKGSALLYILIAIALLGALTSTLIEPASNQSRVQNAHKIVTELESQLNFVRSAIQECVAVYSSGDPTIVNGTGVDDGYIAPYPITATETHFTGSTLGVASGTHAKYIRCPGNPGVDNNHTPLFGGSSGRFFPNEPDFFFNWFYYNGSYTHQGAAVDGVYLRITSDKTDPQIGLALSQLAAKYTDCEADYIIGDGTNGCVDGRQCFRYWIIRKSAC